LVTTVTRVLVSVRGLLGVVEIAIGIPLPLSTTTVPPGVVVPYPAGEITSVSDTSSSTSFTVTSLSGTVSLPPVL
jgi:hypothetical protein